MARIPFTKPALSVEDQLQKLIDRGLRVDDADEARHYLRHIGYYRLAGYTLPFQRGGAGPDRHEFTREVSFDEILDRYVFDRKLRLLLLDAIERIEVSVRAGLSNSIAARHSPHWYTKPALFNPGYDHAALITEIKRQIGHGANTPAKMNRQDIFIRHYYATYSRPSLPPSWMVFESISFGIISKIVENLIKSECKDICARLETNHKVLSSWMHSISYVRNLCAHHSRVWNRTLTIKPIIPKKMKQNISDNTKIYAIILFLHVLMDKIAPETLWATKLRELIADHPNVPIDDMGFPGDWEEHGIWNFN